MNQPLSSYLNTLFYPHAEVDLERQIQQSVLSLLEGAIKLAESPTRETEEAIHDLRVRFKQLRAYWQLMRYTPMPEVFKTAYDRLNSAAKKLGGLRDQHVLIDSLQTLRQQPKSNLKRHHKATIDILIAQINETAKKHPAQTEIDWYFILSTLKLEQTFWLSFSQHIAPPILCSKRI